MANLLERIVSVLKVTECREMIALLEAQLSGQVAKPVATVKNNELKFDLTVIYKMYPRKIGKATGLKKLARRIKTQADFDNVFAAVNAYDRHCKNELIEDKFIMHFSTWVMRYEDWIPGNTDKPKELTPNYDSLFKPW